MSRSFIFNFFLYFIISSFIFIVPFVLGAFCHLLNKRIFDWIGLAIIVPHQIIWSLYTGHPSTASAPITALLYNGLLLCSFNLGQPLAMMMMLMMCTAV